MSTPRVLVLGGGYAGLMAAARVARSGAADVTLLDARAAFTQRIRMHELLAGGVPAAAPYGPMLERRGVRFLHASAESLDAARARVVARRPNGTRVLLDYDWLVVALGSRTAAPAPGVVDHALRLNDPDAIRAAAERLPTLAARRGRVLIVGAGLTGIETATELAERHPGLRVTLVARGALGDGWSSAAEGAFRARFGELGIELREGTGIAALEAGRAWTSSGDALPFDLAVWAGGFEASPFGAAAGLPVDAAGRVQVDAGLRVPGLENIFVAGDAAVAAVDGLSIRMGCVSALPLGAHAGGGVVRAIERLEPVPMDFAFAIRCVSLGRRIGVVQSVRSDDTPVDRVLAGRAGALVKELVCRMTFALPRAELRTGLPLFRWPRGAARSRHGAAPHAGSPALGSAR